MFDPNSRYFDPTLKDIPFKRSDGRHLSYRPLRTVPPPDALPVRTELDSKIGERPDQLAARTLGDPELSWRLFDANVVIDPFALPTLSSRPWRVPSL